MFFRSAKVCFNKNFTGSSDIVAKNKTGVIFLKSKCAYFKGNYNWERKLGNQKNLVNRKVNFGLRMRTSESGCQSEASYLS